MTKRDMFIRAHKMAKADKGIGTYREKFRFALKKVYKQKKAIDLINMCNDYELFGCEVSRKYLEFISDAKTQKEKEFLTREYISRLKRISRFVMKNCMNINSTVNYFYDYIYRDYLLEKYNDEFIERLFTTIMQNTRDDEIKRWSSKKITRAYI